VKKLLVIVLLLLAVPGGVWLIPGERQSAPGNSAAGQRLFPGLENKVNAITRIRVEHNGRVYEVVKKGDQWQLPDKGDYPVLFGRVKPLLLGLARLEKIEPKTGKPENYARLGVQAPGAGTGNTRVELYPADGDAVASLIVGVTRSGLIAGGRDGIYVRVSGEPHAWLVAGNLNLPVKPVDWVDRQIIHIKPKTVQRVTIRQPGGDTLVVEKRHRGVATYNVVNMPDGATLKAGVEINTLARGLAALKMDDVLLHSGAGLAGSGAVEAVFETWDGLRVTAWTVEREGDIFAWFDVSANPAEVPAPSGAGGAQAAAEALQARLEDRVYRLPRDRGEKLRKQLDDIIER